MTDQTANLKTMQALARRLLWIAYCWNDRNFAGSAKTYALDEAKDHGIKTFEEANAFIEQMKLEQEAQPTSEPDGLGFYLGGPYHDGTYSICEAATGRVRHIFNPATDDHHIEGSKYNSRGVNTTSEAPAGREQ